MTRATRFDERLTRVRAAFEPRPWTWCWAVAATLLVVRARALRLFDAVRPLDSFRDRAIGATTMQGVDASGYARGYVELVALSGVAFLVAAAVAALVQRGLSARGIDRRLRGEIWFLQLSSLFVVLALALSFLARWSSMLTVAWLLFGFQALAVALAVVRILGSRAEDPVRRRVARQLARPPLLVHALAVAFSVGLTAWSLVAHHSRLESLAGAPALALLGLATGLIAWSTARSLTRNGPRRPLARRLARDFPLLLLPAALVVANEAQYRISSLPVTVIALLTIAGVVALVPLTGRLAARLADRLRLPSSHRLAWWLYAPTVLASLTLLCAYRHGYVATDFDAFHKGEQLLPTHQLFRFGVVPLVDLRLTHTLSDLVYPTAYTLFHGFRPGEHAVAMLTWMKWMPVVVAIPLLYWLLASATTPLFAVLVCAAAPALALMSPYYAMALLPALLLGHFARRPTTGRLAAVWLALLWLIGWRIDFGMAGVLATLLVLGARWLSPPRLDARSVARALAPALLVAVVGLLGLGLLSAQPLIPSLLHLLESYSYRLATRLRPEIIPDYGMLAALQYYLLPAAGIAVVLAFVGRRLLGAGTVRSTRYPLLFLALFSLVISVRSLTRHSLIENFNGYLFFALFVLFPAFVTAEAGPATRRRALWVVLGLFFLRLLLLLPPAGQTTGALELTDLVPGPAGFELRDWQGDEVRYRIDTSPFEDALAFLDEHLDTGETFFDFTNSPALFVIADLPFPTWMIPTLAATSETIQAQMLGELDVWRADHRLPFVLFKQGTYWDSLEGVYPEVRSYRIAEWVYRNYRPLVRFGGYEIWQDRREDPIAVDWRTEVEFRVRQRIVGPSIEVERLSRSRGVTVHTGDEDPHLYGFLRMRGTPDLATRDRWIVEIEGRSSVAERFQIFYQLEGEEFDDDHSFTVEATDLDRDETEVWRLPLDETAGRIVDFRIDPPEHADFEIHRVTLTGTTDGIVGLSESGVDQRFDLRSLPRVWAELDPLDALHSTPTVSVLLDEPVLIRPGGSLYLDLDPELDRTDIGYALLRLKSAHNLRESAPSDTRLYLRYDSDNCCGFVFDLGELGGEDGQYLVRLATQWRWSFGEIESLRVWTTHPMVLERVELRGLD